MTAGNAFSVVLPANGTLTGSVKDDGLPLNSVLIITWTKVSGPGGVTFANPHSPLTTAAFDVAGTYVLQLSATDSALTSTATVTVTVTGSNSTNPPGTSEPGWISGVTDRGNVSGVVTISVPVGTTLTSGVLSYYSVTDPTATPIVITPSTVGTGTIGTLDTTLLPNGSYWIQLNATNNVGLTQNNIAMVTVVGDYKPGRVTASITDLTVPAPGLPISIVRSYDSLERNKVQDFGNGWSLSTNVKLEVDPSNNVTLTLNGKRRTFYFTPQPNGIFVFFYLPQYTPEPGMYGSLTNTSDNCLGVLIRVGNLYQCGIQPAGNYKANGFVYTDPYGRIYTIGSDSTLRSLKDLNGNLLTVTTSGITSSNGITVPFVRDSQGRITRITDPLGNQYIYAYDTNGNLITRTLPPNSAGTSPFNTYGYDSSHLLISDTDPRGKRAAATYYADGKLKSNTTAMGDTISYAYDVSLATTTITNPNGGILTLKNDLYGQLLSFTDAMGRKSTYGYNPNHSCPN